MARIVNLSRRRFLQVSTALGGGLCIGVLTGCDRDSDTEPAAPSKAAPAALLKPNAWVRIDTQGRVTLVVARSEMGQGVTTALPMLIAEELEVALDQVSIETAPVERAYVNRLLGKQITGGSTSVREAWEPLRTAGAAARDLLLTAAAQQWRTDPESCDARDGYVVHSDGRRLAYGALVEAAARLPVPERVLLKEPEEFRLIGQPQPRLDAPAKVDGSARFGMDVRLPGMRYAMVVRCPVFGGKPARWDARRAQQMAGVRAVFAIDSGIAIVADSTWQAWQARAGLEVQWDEGALAQLDSDGIRAQALAALGQPGRLVRDVGNVADAWQGRYRLVQADYETPYQAHACMEPMNCTVHVRKDRCDIWTGTQAQGPTQAVASALTGLPAAAVQVHTTYLGGGFGRRFETDFVHEAVQIAQRVDGPVKVVWTREDDIQHDYYRPASFHRLRAALDDNGRPVAWQHHIAAPSIMQRVFPAAVRNGVDGTSVEGADALPYAIAAQRVEYSLMDFGVPVGFWRSVGNSQNAYVTECFFDELAAAGAQDPVALRLALLGEAPRHRAVLQAVAEAAQWGRPPAAGRARGVALVESFHSYVAQIAEVSVHDNAVQVHKIFCAVDCGLVINPSIVQAQMHSAIVFGLSAVLKGQITLQRGRVQQSDFADFPLLRMDEMPDIQVRIVPSEESPGGVGEPGTPPTAPAVANALRALTGAAVRRLPVALKAAARAELGGAA